MKITASEVNKLRQATGAGMMDCKKALVEAEGDFDKAVENLRKKGQKVAANRADRDSAEGAVLAKDAREIFEELGPTYIKLGQMMSVRPDVLPKDALNELKILQDRVSTK